MRHSRDVGCQLADAFLFVLELPGVESHERQPRGVPHDAPPSLLMVRPTQCPHIPVNGL